MPTKDPNQGTIELEDDGQPQNLGDIRRDGTDLFAKDGAGVFNLRSGTGLTPGTHRPLDQLVHEIAESSVTEYEYTGARVDAIRIYTDAGKLTKIREQEFTYVGNKATQITTKQYAAGVLVETLTEDLAYTGSNVDTITGVLT
jgi:hypothetical protein